MLQFLSGSYTAHCWNVLINETEKLQNCKSMFENCIVGAGLCLATPKLWIEKTNDLVDIETDISLNLKGLVAIDIATAVSLAGVETAIWFWFILYTLLKFDNKN